MTKKAPTPSIFDAAPTIAEPKATRSGSCTSLTHKSTLTYSIAETNNDTLYQLTSNSATGHFSQEWIALSAIRTQLGGSTFNSTPLRALFQGKSLNSSGFLLAVLLAEGLVQLIPGKRRLYQFISDGPVDPSPTAESHKTVASGMSGSSSKTPRKIPSKSIPKAATSA